jgi:SOS-response transcriptional repressor LexA
MPLKAVHVIGDVQGGHFREALEWPPEDQYDVMVEVDPVSSRYPLFGLKVIGPSMNREFPEGSVAICVRCVNLPEGYQIRPGQFVVVLRRNHHGPDEFEATIKQFDIDRQGRAWLWPRSDHPEFQEPIPAHGMGNDDFGEANEDLTVFAVVVGQNKRYGL